MKTFLVIEGDPDFWGIIPSFLDVADRRTAQQQIDANYMGGWSTAKRWLRYDPTNSMLVAIAEAEGDPPLEPRSKLYFRDEMLIIYDHAWVVIMQKDGTWDVARLD